MKATKYIATVLVAALLMAWSQTATAQDTSRVNKDRYNRKERRTEHRERRQAMHERREDKKELADNNGQRPLQGKHHRRHPRRKRG
jgi:Ni/Co efflux regulator RcnB